MKEIGYAKEIYEYLHHRTGNPLEEALMIRDLMEKYKLTQKQVAKETGLSQGQISKRLRLLKLHPELQERLRENKLLPSIAYELSKLPTEIQLALLKEEKITLKKVEEKKRELVINKEIYELLEQRLDPEKCKHKFVCVYCGKELEK